MNNKRVDIKTGFMCNNNCMFCVQAHKKHLGNRTTEEIKKDLRESRKRCAGVVLTGGEPTIRKDIFTLIRKAKKIGYTLIQIQTNGRMFSSFEFCKKTIKAGANEFSPALHGYCSEQHDFLTRAPGSFAQTVEGIKNLKKLGQKVITNTVVVKSNYRDLEKIAELLVRLKVDQFQFAFVHPIGNAMKYYEEVVPMMSLTAPYIHKGLQTGINANIKCMAEAMPYCMMQGYENYISEKFIPETEIKDFDTVIDDYKSIRIKEGKAKFPQCRECKYDEICEGPWREYPEKRGDEEFKAIINPQINLDPKTILQLTSVAKNFRNCGRYETNNSKAKKTILKLIKNLNLNFKIINQENRHLIYFSKNKETLRKITNLHSKSNKNPKEFSETNRKIGKEYGYPDCCNSFFSKNPKNIIDKDDFPLIKETIKNTLNENNSPFIPWYTNIFSRDSLIFHIPHSFHCPHSINLAKTNLSILKNKGHNTEKIKNSLTKALIIKEKSFALENYKLVNEEIKIDNKEIKIDNLKENNVFLFSDREEKW